VSTELVRTNSELALGLGFDLRRLVLYVGFSVILTAQKRKLKKTCLLTICLVNGIFCLLLEPFGY